MFPLAHEAHSCAEILSGNPRPITMALYFFVVRLALALTLAHRDSTEMALNGCFVLYVMCGCCHVCMVCAMGMCMGGEV